MAAQAALELPKFECREHRHPRHLIEVARDVGGAGGDLGHLLGAGVDVDGAVGEQLEVVLEDAQVDAAGALAGPRADDLQGRADGLGVAPRQAGDHAVGLAGLHHQGGEDVARAHLLARLAHRHPAPLAQLVVGLDVLGEARIARRVDDLDAGERLELLGLDEPADVPRGRRAALA